jgi:hypothetical protein
VDEDVEDDAQDLLIYLKFSPARSFNRGEVDKVCRDVIEAFGPGGQGAASERIFRRYLKCSPGTDLQRNRSEAPGPRYSARQGRLHEVNTKLSPFCAMPRILSVAMVGSRVGSSRASAFR